MTTRPTADLMLLRLADDARVMQDNVNSFELRIFKSEGHTAVRYLGDTAKDLLSLLADRARMEKALREREAAYEFVKLVSRLDHTGDDGHTFADDPDDSMHALDSLIAKARDLLTAPLREILGEALAPQAQGASQC